MTPDPSNSSGSSGSLGSLDETIDGRAAFHDAVRRVLAEAARNGWRELYFCDRDFAGWPLDDAGVLANLSAWLRPHRRLALLASHYDELARRHPRWVAWRRARSHAVACRQADAEIPAADIPTLLFAPDKCVVHLFDPMRCRGVISTAGIDVASARSAFDAISQRSTDAFGPTTLGL
jgi:hypothetical protein